MLDLQNKGDCSGCHACMSACPKGAISMEADREGFLYPAIDPAACVNCGLCERLCQALSPIRTERRPSAYACWNRDEAVRAVSSSGGIFHALAGWIIQHGGVVYGAAFDDRFAVRHIAVESMEQLPLLQGSKYVQSTIGSAFSDAEKQLIAGRYVLFTGTPCQIDGLLHYLRRDYAHLYTQDLICHGAPSPAAWEQYLDYQTKIHHGPPAQEPLPSFRQKEEGWKRYSRSLHFGKDMEYRRFHREDFYMQAFLGNLSLRPSCYECRSKTKNRNSDITLADFWGIESLCPELFDDRGTSLVLVSSEKGRQLFDAVKETLLWREVDFEAAISHNPAAYRSADKPAKRDAFFAHLQGKRFDRLVKSVTLPPLYRRACWHLRRRIGTICRRLSGFKA